jgi:hypothetical protein
MKERPGQWLLTSHLLLGAPAVCALVDCGVQRRKGQGWDAVQQLLHGLV